MLIILIFYCATLRAVYFLFVSHRFFTLSVPAVIFCGAKLHKIFDIYKFSFKKNKQFEDFLFGSLKDFRSVI